MPVVGSGDDDCIDIRAIQNAPEVAGHESGRLAEVAPDQLTDLGALGIIHVAKRDALRARTQHVAEVASAHASTADQAYPDATIGAGDPILRLCRPGRRPPGNRRPGDEEGADSVFQKRAAGARGHGSSGWRSKRAIVYSISPETAKSRMP